MNNIKFTFSILHYKTLDDTIKCIDSINNLSYKCDIVVVDNGSHNGSFEALKDKYTTDNIHFIDNDTNIGFAGANNIGYKYAKDILKSDFIAVINNDVLIKTKDFVEYLINKFNEDKYYVAGPSVLDVDERKHNPQSISVYNYKELPFKIIKYKAAYVLSKLGLYNLVKNRLDNNEKAVKLENDVNRDDIQYDVFLSGCFLIYSPLYIVKEDYAFYPGTFLYFEETIMHYYCNAKGYKMAYYPYIEIIHKGQSSTNAITKTDKKKMEFVLYHQGNSLKVLRKVMNEYGDNK